MSRHAVIENGVVINTIDYATTPSPVPGFPEDAIAVQTDIANIGWLYADDVFTDPNAPSPAEQTEEAWTILRHFRDSRLTLCDWTQASDTALTPTQVDAWKVYRTALRDLPSNTVDPFNPQWPIPPAS